MGSKVQLAKWGNSLAVRIPKSIAEQADLHEGDAVELMARQGRVIVKPARPPQPTLKQLLARVTRENVHEETDWGRPVGKEVME
jgi:antitoxin MazE